MDDPLVLYSTNSWLAFSVSERYYGGVHYVWCSPFYNPEGPLSPAAMPTTAIPGLIYSNWHRDVSSGDRDSSWIGKNKVGLLKGAGVKKAAGQITALQHDEIVSIVTSAAISDFKPLVYVIPFSSVSALVSEVPPAERAHPLAVEYRIVELPRNLFSIIDPWRTT